MSGICKPELAAENFQPRYVGTILRSILKAALLTFHRELYIADGRRAEISRAIGRWDFNGHDYSEDELVHAACLMLEHALSMAELSKWRMSAGESKALFKHPPSFADHNVQENLERFVMASRSAYNSFVLYHNFRHAIDVLQSLFYFLVQNGVLPLLPLSTPPSSSSKAAILSPMAALLEPFDALMLLVSAIGHDVGHPGVNNMFLVKLKAPLAQLYNDQSVLESFHCAAYSQILRRHWPVIFDDDQIRKLMISSILATDMGLHFTYMRKVGNLQEKLHENGGTDGWNPKVLEEYKALLCGLLIKCADISNVVCFFAPSSNSPLSYLTRLALGPLPSNGRQSCRTNLPIKVKWRGKSEWRRHYLAGLQKSGTY